MRKDHVCGFRTLRRQISSSVVFPPLKQLLVHVLGLREFKSISWGTGGILQPLLTGCYWTRTGGGVDLHHYWGISSNGSWLTPPPRGHPPLIPCDRGCYTLVSWSVSNHVFIYAKTTQVLVRTRWSELSFCQTLKTWGCLSIQMMDCSTVHGVWLRRRKIWHPD